MVEIGDTINEMFKVTDKFRKIENSGNFQTYITCQCYCGKFFTGRVGDILKRKKCSCNTKRKNCGKKDFKYEFKGLGEISFSHFNNIKRGAKYRKKEFDITIEYIWDLFLKQDRKCNITKEELVFESWNPDTKVFIKQTASLDRIDNTKGYLIGNVQWLHTDINFIKGTLKQEDFIQMCREITSWTEKGICIVEYKEIPKFTSMEHPNWKGYGEIPATIFNTWKKEAAERGFCFEVSIEEIWELFLKQERKCKLTGATLSFGNRLTKSKGFPMTASLDRIDCGMGYISGNVQWVHQKVNLARKELPLNIFLPLCKKALI